ncbi:TSUP family transporter [Haloarcula salinisoli]|uniref:Probable membrane transporter protein n=1 Tax=Haloarcula salinisoli TaxID=2487746 RepID=A0A8J7YEQ0_9EURY|nr:TSUP family transporter [Halomicroarcula salinisoli]MBX0287771.1 TSUP family transporter [Halomicroarcula salinisoli]MBX0304695.1 TSUP family transporter [Halomicroarcula salinisoli]
MLQALAVGGFGPATLLTVAAVVFLGGLVKGTAGFGYAIVSTAVLATLFSPTVAVVVMILPMLVGNLRLLGELDRAEIPQCVARFWPYVLGAAVGTLAGMAMLGRIPRPVLALGLGLFTLAYVAATQPWVVLPGEAWTRERCFRPGTAAKVGVGLVSGVVFGATNAAVQVVAYLDSLDLDRSTFVGVLAMILVGISLLRLGAAWGLGLFAAGDAAPVTLLALSAVAAVPGLAGVAAGQRLRRRLADGTVTAGALLLLTLIGLKLLADGATGL